MQCNLQKKNWVEEKPSPATAKIDKTANTNAVKQTDAWDALHCGEKSLYMN